MSVPTPVMRAADEWIAAARQLAGVGEPLREGHRDPGADRGGQAGDERVDAACGVSERDREDRGERRERAVDQADHRRLDTLEEELVLGTSSVYSVSSSHTSH